MIISIRIKQTIEKNTFVIQNWKCKLKNIYDME